MQVWHGFTLRIVHSLNKPSWAAAGVINSVKRLCLRSLKPDLWNAKEVHPAQTTFLVLSPCPPYHWMFHHLTILSLPKLTVKYLHNYSQARATGDCRTHCNTARRKLERNRSLISLICIDVLFKVAASTGQVMKIHTGCFSKQLLQGHWIEPFPILKALINEGKSASTNICTDRVLCILPSHMI